MPPSEAAAIAAFARRTFVGAFLGGMAQAILVVAVAAAVAQIVVRLAGGHLAPSPWWSAVAIPVVLFAWWRARGERMPMTAAAQHLDRRLDLRGLLLAAHDGVPLEEVWQQQIAAKLPQLASVLPRVQWRRVLPWPALALAVVAAIALLPPPPPSTPPIQRAAVASEVERLAQNLRDLLARGTVPEEQKQDLEKKLQELQRRLAEGEVPEWRDVDQLEQRLEREQLLQAAAAGRQGAEGSDAGKTTSAEITPQQVAAAANALAAAGLLDKLPEGLRAMLEQSNGERGFDAAGLPQDSEALRRLAEAMAKAAGDPLAFAGRQQLNAGQLADLQAVLEAFPGAAALGQGEGEGLEGEGEGVGRGGVDRGPGHAALSMTEDAQGGADAAMPLPPGVAAPTEWVPIGSRPSEPEVKPVANAAPGSAAASGTGGASWQLQLAPRHRAVVQRFFGSAGAGGTTKDKR